MLQLSDDWVPCHDWDVQIWSVLEKAARSRWEDTGKPPGEFSPETIANTPLVVAVHDNHRTDALLCMAILTRARYEEQRDEIEERIPRVDSDGKPAGEVIIQNPGAPYLFSPEYVGVFSDNEFTVRAYRDGCVIQAQHIIFDHQHPIWGGVPEDKWDETYRAQNAPERYTSGAAIFKRRNPAAP